MQNQTLICAIFFAVQLFGCGGGGSSAPGFPPPKTVEATSYGNKHDIALDDPHVTALLGSDGRTVAFGDFFQEGEYSAFVTVNLGASREVRFLKKNGSIWSDHTPALLSNASAMTVCGEIAQALTADFNGDDKPDVFLVCGMSAASEQQIVMSQSGSSTYVRQSIKNSLGQTIQLQGWGAAAADIDDDGDIDIVMAQGNEVVALENKIKSHGYWDLHAINQNPWIAFSSPQNFPTYPRKVFLIPRAGAGPDLVVGGDGDASNITFAWMQSLNATTPPFYRFNSNSSSSSYANAYRMANNNKSASVYDVAKKGSNLLVLAKDENPTLESSAATMVLLSFAFPNPGSVFPLPTVVNYSGNPAPNFISQFKLNSSGRLVAYDGACVSGQTRCSFSANP